MKRIFLAAFALSLSSCALWDAYLMAPYDANEYMLITEIRASAGQYRRQCHNPVLAPVNAQAISVRTDLFEKYAEMIPRNNNGYQAAKALNEIAQGLSTQYNEVASVSTTFCRLKYNNIEKSAESIQRATAGRPR